MAFRKELKFWGLSLFLYLPFLLHHIYFAFCLARQGYTPAGFISFEHMLQMSQAQEYVNPGVHLTAGNPASPFYGTPCIYFQPLLLFLGVFWKLTGMDAASVWLIFGFLMALVCARLALALYQELVGFEGTAKKLGVLIFFWGGGAIALTGGLIALLGGEGISHESLFALEPLQGIWPLNFGRNLLSPVDAFLHGLFFATMLCMLRKRFMAAILLVAIAALSDFYTSAQLLSILVAWGLFERYFMRSSEVPPWFTRALVMTGVLHFFYYFVFLGSFDEHNQVMIQGASALMHAKNSFPAWLFVGLLFFFSFRTIDHARLEFSRPSRRLLLAWLFISLLLAHHQFAFTPPLSPLHFARGSIWTALFFLGSPALIALIGFILARKNPLLRSAGVLLMLALFLCDNTLWLATRRKGGESLFYRSAQERELLDWMNGKESTGRVVVSMNISLNCHVVLYTSLRAWVSYPLYTPYYEKRVKEVQALFQSGTWADEWRSIPLAIVYEREVAGADPPPWMIPHGGRLAFQNARYCVYFIHTGERPVRDE